MDAPSTSPLSEGIARLARKASQRALQHSSQSAKTVLGALQLLNDHFKGAYVALSAKRWTHRRSRRKGLPLPLPPTLKSSDSVQKVTKLLEEVFSTLLCMLHDVHKNLQFWKARAEGTDTQKMIFMLLERGPYAFLQGVVKLLHDSIWESNPTTGIVIAAVSQISIQAELLSALECRVATVLGEVYKEADRFGECILEGQTSAAISMALVSIYKAIGSLEGSYDLNQTNYSGTGPGGMDLCVPSLLLRFKELPEYLLQKKELAESEISTFVELILENVMELENFLSILMQNYRKPRRAAHYWLRYTGGAVGLALVSGWIIQHSTLVGSHDLEKWVKQGGEAIAAFTKEHVETPLLSIRDDLFETFRRRHGGAGLEDVRLTADSFHRMLKAFVEQSKEQIVDSNSTEQELMEIVMNRYEKEITRPLQSLIGGELFRAMLIQVQKLKLDIETAMLELNQILRANEINFAVLAALPAFLFAVILGWLLKVSLFRDKSAEGRRKSCLHRRMLLAEVEKMLTYCQILEDGGKRGDMSCYYGMAIYFLGRFYQAVEMHAKKSGEWSSLHGDILDLAKPTIGLSCKLAITARMERFYECITPSISL